jgi:hypothetical protein
MCRAPARMLKVRSVFAFPLNFQPLRCEHFPERVVLGQVAPARVLARAHAAHDTGQLQLPQRFGVAAPVANAQQPLLRTPCCVEPRAYLLDGCHPARDFGATGGGVGVACLVGKRGQAVDGVAAGVGVVVQPSCNYEALGFAQSACWKWYTGCVLWCCPSGCPISRCLGIVIVGIGIPDGAFVFQGVWVRGC